MGVLQQSSCLWLRSMDSNLVSINFLWRWPGMKKCSLTFNWFSRSHFYSRCCARHLSVVITVSRVSVILETVLSPFKSTISEFKRHACGLSCPSCSDFVPSPFSVASQIWNHTCITRFSCFRAQMISLVHALFRRLSNTLCNCVLSFYCQHSMIVSAEWSVIGCREPIGSPF